MPTPLRLGSSSVRGNISRIHVAYVHGSCRPSCSVAWIRWKAEFHRYLKFQQYCRYWVLKGWISEMRSVQQIKRPGFSLIELVVVVMVLAILAGLVVTLMGGMNEISTPGGPKSDREIITETSMRAVRDAILGTDRLPGAWPDLGQQPNRFPTDPSQLLVEVHPTVGAFDPVTRIGWRGPYLRGAFRQEDGTNVFLDGWGNPMSIFIPDINGDSMIGRDEIQYARLVSNGENGVLDTLESHTEDYIPGGADPATSLTVDECGDDVLLFFFVADTRNES